MEAKFPTDLARVVLAKAGVDAQQDRLKQRYTEPQIAEIEHRVLKERQRKQQPPLPD